MADSTADTKDHIIKVQHRMNDVLTNLAERAAAHDLTKLEEPEKSAYDRLMEYKATHEVVYGSPEYAESLKLLGPALEHHYAHNSHHPEHWPDGIAGMSLLSIIEMLCDWKAASERTKQGSIAQSLAHNQQRFSIDPQLARILENTVRELGW